MSDAADLAQVFFNWSHMVNQYRNDHLDQLTPDQRSRLKDLAHQLDDVSDHFGLEDVAQTLAGIQADIQKIKNITLTAQQTLKRLKTITEVAKIASAVAALGLAAASGNLKTVEGAVGDLAALVPEQTKAATGGGAARPGGAAG